MRIDYRSCVGQHVSRLVVIGNDELYAKLLCKSSFINCGNSVVHGDYKLRAFICKASESVRTETVALAPAVYIVTHVPADTFQI